MLNNEIVSEQMLTIKRSNSNQLSKKVNGIESKLLPDMKRAVMQIKEKVHIGGSALYLYKNMASLLQNLNSEMHFELGARNNYKECLVNVHAVKNTT